MWIERGVYLSLVFRDSLVEAATTGATFPGTPSTDMAIGVNIEEIRMLTRNHSRRVRLHTSHRGSSNIWPRRCATEQEIQSQVRFPVAADFWFSDAGGKKNTPLSRDFGRR